MASFVSYGCLSGPGWTSTDSVFASFHADHVSAVPLLYHSLGLLPLFLGRVLSLLSPPTTFDAADQAAHRCSPNCPVADIVVEHSRDEDKMWFYLTTFGFPVPIAIIGIWNARRRRRFSEVSS